MFVASIIVDKGMRCYDTSLTTPNLRVLDSFESITCFLENLKENKKQILFFPTIEKPIIVSLTIY